MSREDDFTEHTSSSTESINYYQHFERLSHWWLRETTALVVEIMHRSIAPASNVLDAGCGPGELMKLLADQYRIIGIDVSDRAVTFARRNGLSLIVRGDLEHLPFAQDIFDAVVSLDVLYHADIGDDGRALREIRRVLRPGGWLILNLPAYEWMRSAHDDFIQTARRYTAGRVRDLLKEAGLSVERATYRNTLLFPLAVVQRHVLQIKNADSIRMPGWLSRMLGAALAIERYWLRWTGFPFGLSVLAVGRKPCPLGQGS
jgi:SAM-dependent methyltransferase